MTEREAQRTRRFGHKGCKFCSYVWGDSHISDSGSIPGFERSPGEGTGSPLQYSCLGNSLDRGTWWAVIPRVTKEQDTMEQLTTATLVALALFCQSAQNQCLPRRGEVSHGNEWPGPGGEWGHLSVLRGQLECLLVWLPCLLVSKRNYALDFFFFFKLKPLRAGK